MNGPNPTIRVGSFRERSILKRLFQSGAHRPFAILGTFAVGFAAMSGTYAAAQIASATAVYRGGILTVQGQTWGARQRVTLNGFHIKNSNSEGHFEFRQTLIPASCSVRLSAGGHSHVVPIQRCPHTKRVSR